MRVKVLVRELVLATGNVEKAAALKRVVSVCGIETVSMADPQTQEEGPEFVDNARAKTLLVSPSKPGALTIGSDGGLTIPALGRRWDPMRTSRFAPGGPWEKACALLELMSDLHGAARAAMWTEALAVAQNGVLLASWTARGPLCIVRTQVPSQIGPFWVDALLERRGHEPGHWRQLEARFAAWWRS